MEALLSAAGLDAERCAGILGIDAHVFKEWAAGQRTIPPGYSLLLSAVLGVSEADLMANTRRRYDRDQVPAIWFKFRGEGLAEVDREAVLLIRQLGYYINQLEAATKETRAVWKALFQAVLDGTDLNAAPGEQGRQAARAYRVSTGLDSGARGLGTVLRGFLRNSGVLVVESAIKKSIVNGCTFFVGDSENTRPCIFANNYRTTWFRRNYVLAHELAHAIFDAKRAGASLDFENIAEAFSSTDISEVRADSFAIELLVPFEVLNRASAEANFRWDSPTAASLAVLVDKTSVEPLVLTRAAVSTGLMDPSGEQTILDLDYGTHLRAFCSQALSVEEYAKRFPDDVAEWRDKRGTTLPSRRFLLPVGYVKNVVEAQQRGIISRGKAAELLMIDRGTFDERFGAEAADDAATW